MKKQLLFIFTAVSLINAAFAQPTLLPPQVKAVKDTSSGKMALIMLQVKRMDATYSIVISGVRIINGSAKLPVDQPAKQQKGDLLFFVTDNKKVKLDSILVKQPLTRRYEYPGNNSTIESKEVELNEASILIRCKYNTAFAFLQYYATGTSKEKQELISLPFTQTQ